MNIIKTGSTGRRGAVAQAGETPLPHVSPTPYLYKIPVDTTPLPREEEFVEFVIIRRKCADKRWSKKAGKYINWLNWVRVALKELKTDAEEAATAPELLFGYAINKKISLGYFQCCISVLNLYNEFIALKEKRYMPKHPRPTGEWTAMIHDAFESSGKSAKVSKELREDTLKKAESRMRPEHFNWLWVSLYFGLRPHEVDNLHDARKFRIDDECLFVEQPKSKRLSRKMAWKTIPALFQEQYDGLAIIRSGNFKRPSRHIMLAVFGKGVYVYGGRKGFVRMITKRNLDIEAASLMLGHTDLNMTKKFYADLLDLQIERIKRWRSQHMGTGAPAVTNATEAE